MGSTLPQLHRGKSEHGNIGRLINSLSSASAAIRNKKKRLHLTSQFLPMNISFTLYTRPDVSLSSTSFYHLYFIHIYCFEGAEYLTFTLIKIGCLLCWVSRTVNLYSMHTSSSSCKFGFSFIPRHLSTPGRMLHLAYRGSSYPGWDSGGILAGENSGNGIKLLFCFRVGWWRVVNTVVGLNPGQSQSTYHRLGWLEALS